MKTTAHHIRIVVFLLLQQLSSIVSAAETKSTTWQLNAFTQHFTTFAKEYPQEKVYLHFDNTAYYQGENIWFKAYVVRADRNALSQMSKILYVDLLNEVGQVIESQKLKIEDGQCHGNFKPLKNTIYAGFYEVRAYTRYMLNFGQTNYFSRVFPVYDKPKAEGAYNPDMTEPPFSQRLPQERPEYKQKENLALTFYPEGGNLIAGVDSRVAFKATGKEGESAVVSGEVYNSKNEKVADLTTEYQGMGQFELLPDSGKYTAKVQYNNKEYKFELPQVLLTGYAMSVDNLREDEVRIQIATNLHFTGDLLGISISSRGVLYGTQQVDMSNTHAASFSFPKKMLPSGVSQITLFNPDGQVMSERLIFVNHHSQMKMAMSQSKPIYHPFEKVNMDFQLNDMKGNPIETTFSVAIRDASTSSTNPYENNILTDLLLSSEVKGYIEHPEYYFEKEDIPHRIALDLLLMTQGWTRYIWKEMAGVTPFKIQHPMEKGLVMDGYVVSLFRGKKMKDTDITMILLSDSLSQHGTCQTDSLGDFNFALKEFKGEAKVILQSKLKNKRKEMQIRLNRNFTPDLREYSHAELNIPLSYKEVRDTIIEYDTITGNQDELQRLLPKNNSKLPIDKRNHLLKEVVVKEKRLPIKVSYTYEVTKEMERRRDVGEWQPAELTNLLHFTNKYYNANTNKYKFRKVVIMRDDSKTLVTSDINALLTDGEESTQPTEIAFGNPNAPMNNKVGGYQGYTLDEVESVTFIEDNNTIIRLSHGTLNPALSMICLVHLKKNYHKEPIGIRNTTFQGFAYSKEFYCPQYDKIVLPDEKDYRRTLYWNPDVKTDANGKATISFFNNSTCKAMNVSAETVTERGVIGAMCK